MKKPIQIKNAPSPVGSYSQAILKENTLYISGQIPLNPFSGNLVSESIEAETKQVMENIEALLKAANMEMDNLVKCSIFLTDMNNFQKVDKIYSSFFNEIFPARETVQVVSLPKDVNVEISAIACL